MDITPKKSLGQNFLVNPHIIDKIVSAAEISKNDIILEIGPGTGNLTKKLSEKAGKVIAIEKDHRLIEPLREAFKAHPNIEIIEGDVLKLEIEKLFENCKLKIENCHYKVVANIPYYITSILLRTIFESASWRMAQPELIVLTIQKEVAQRIIAKPPNMNLLALSVQYYAEPKVIGYISKNNFRPVPKVDSAIIRLVPKIFEVEPQRFQEVRPRDQQLFNLIRAGFSEKRKQLAPVLSKKLKIDKEKIVHALYKIDLDEKIRPEKLSLDDWQSLSEALFG